jgi:serine/threonine protein kinase
VHRAVDTVLQREVAIKMVAVPEDLAKLSHSNIVHVFDVWARRTLDGEGEELYIVLSTEKVKSCTS